MRLYLDTNVLVYLLLGQGDDLDQDTFAMLFDDYNLLYTSTVCVHEFIYLRQSGKINTGKDWKKGIDVVQRLSEFGIEIATVKPIHLKKEEELPLLEDHRDPNDRLIIAQAIADKATLVSSDLKFAQYRQYGLELHEKQEINRWWGKTLRIPF